MLILQRRSNWLSKMTWTLVREIVASKVYKDAQLFYQTIPMPLT